MFRICLSCSGKSSTRLIKCVGSNWLKDFFYTKLTWTLRYPLGPSQTFRHQVVRGSQFGNPWREPLAYIIISISTWIPKREIMLNKYAMFFLEITKLIEEGSPVDIIYIDFLERIQRTATKMIPELRYLTYEERLVECGLTTLDTGRLRRDQY